MYGAGSYKLGGIPELTDEDKETLKIEAVRSKLEQKIEMLEGREVIALDKSTKILYTPDLCYIVAKGDKLKRDFLKKTPALSSLIEVIQERVEEFKHLRGLDGCYLTVRHAHAALNTLLQSCGAIVMKKATIMFYQSLLKEGYSGFYKSFYTGIKDFAFVLNVHDEYQVTCKPEITPKLSELAVQAIRDAGSYYKMNCELDGEAKVGKSWAETH